MMKVQYRGDLIFWELATNRRVEKDVRNFEGFQWSVTQLKCIEVMCVWVTARSYNYYVSLELTNSIHSRLMVRSVAINSFPRCLVISIYSLFPSVDLIQLLSYGFLQLQKNVQYWCTAYVQTYIWLSVKTDISKYPCFTFVDIWHRNNPSTNPISSYAATSHHANNYTELSKLLWCQAYSAMG